MTVIHDYFESDAQDGEHPRPDDWAVEVMPIHRSLLRLVAAEPLALERLRLTRQAAEVATRAAIRLAQDQSSAMVRPQGHPIAASNERPAEHAEIECGVKRDPILGLTIARLSLRLSQRMADHPDYLMHKALKVCAALTIMCAFLATAGSDLPVFLASAILIVWGSAAMMTHIVAGRSTVDPRLGLILIAVGVGTTLVAICIDRCVNRAVKDSLVRRALVLVLLAIALSVVMVGVLKAVDIGGSFVDRMANIIARLEMQSGWGFDVALDVVVVLLITTSILSTLAITDVTKNIIRLARHFWALIQGTPMPPPETLDDGNAPWKWYVLIPTAQVLSMIAVQVDSFA